MELPRPGLRYCAVRGCCAILWSGKQIIKLKIYAHFAHVKVHSRKVPAKARFVSADSGALHAVYWHLRVAMTRWWWWWFSRISGNLSPLENFVQQDFLESSCVPSDQHPLSNKGDFRFPTLMSRTSSAHWKGQKMIFFTHVTYGFLCRCSGNENKRTNTPHPGRDRLHAVHDEPIFSMASMRDALRWKFFHHSQWFCCGIWMTIKLKMIFINDFSFVMLNSCLRV